jgi:glycosyltransferase involved in cell wall biosynthesis
MSYLLLLLFFLPLPLSALTEFVVIIPSYNNEKYVLDNIDSLRMQTYPHWRAVYIDDCSTDATGELVEHYVKLMHLSKKVKIIHNKENAGSMANCYRWIQKAEPNKVIVHLDGDDRLAHYKVLERLAEVYSDPNVWVTYGNFTTEPESFPYRSEALPKEVIAKNSFRKYHWVTSHLKSYYAKLFHLIDREYFMYEGNFVPMAQDQAIMLPILELSSLGHIRFIDEELYVYNHTNPINDEKRDKELGLNVVEAIRKKEPLKPIQSLF